jgi:two-component system nitrogen regulation sensor histidine kinase NtrY
MLLDAPQVPSPADPASTPPPRRRTLDNPRVLVIAALITVAGIIGVFYIPERLGRMDQTLVSEVVIYAVAAINLAMLAALLFVLARNIIKLWGERRRGAPFAGFRAKLVAAFLALIIIPTSLVLVVGSEFVRTSADRWFSVPVDDALDAAREIASQYYVERQEAVTLRASRLVGLLPADLIEAGDLPAITTLVRAEMTTMRDGLVELYQAVPTSSGQRDAVFLLGQQVGTPPPDVARAAADRLAARVAASGREENTQDPVPSGGILIRAGAPVRSSAGVVVGVVVASLHVPESITGQARRATAAYEQWKQLQVLSGPLSGLYRGVFLMLTLLILTAATWLGFYVAKRITRPVQMLTEGARAIGAGQLDLRLEPQSSDELGSLVDAFNTMAAELGTSQDRLEQSRLALEQKNAEIESRRRYIETVLERVATGVLSLGADGRISTINGAAKRLLAVGDEVVGQPLTGVLQREDLQALLPLVPTHGSAGAQIEELALPRPDGELHLAGASTPLLGADGRHDGAVIVLDDVTPLIRTQRVAAWRDVARRLAHEIKNPLTPIRLSAERLKRNFANAPPNAKALVDECSGAIITEVDALKGLVDEFAQFARLRGPKMAPADLNAIVADTLALYSGLLRPEHSTTTGDEAAGEVLRLETHVAPRLPLVRVDVEQMRQVLINLVDNALDALGGPSAPPRPDGSAARIAVSTGADVAHGTVWLSVTDNGPGIPQADRDKLFQPYHSTKGRGTGLGLAIVQRIVAEHGGRIDVGDDESGGARFTLILPAE